MSLERPTDNRYPNSRRTYYKKRRQRIIFLRSIALIACLLVVVLFGVILLVNFFKGRIHNYYNSEEGYARIFQTDEKIDELKPFAADLAVASNTVDSFSTEFTAETGLLVEKGMLEATFSRDSYKHMNPASTTKIMTAIVALKYGDLTDQVVVPEEAVIDEYGASLAGIKPGQTLSLGQLLYGLMLPSGNDAANTIAMHIGGSIDGFIDMMNEEAKRLGCVDTHFVNAHGMTEADHYTSAYDLYLMMNEAIRYDEFNKICKTKLYIAEFYDVDGLAISKTWENTNKYVLGKEELPYDLAVLAGKTGTTMAAGNCLVLATEDSTGNQYISIVLNSDSKDSLYSNMNYLLAKID